MAERNQNRASGNTATMELSTDTVEIVNASPAGVVDANGTWFVKFEEGAEGRRTQYASQEQAEQAWKDHAATKSADIQKHIAFLNRLVNADAKVGDGARLIVVATVLATVAKQSVGTQRGRQNVGEQYRNQQGAIMKIDEDALRPIFDDATMAIEALNAVDKAPSVPLATLKNPITQAPETIYPAHIVAAVKEMLLPSGRGVQQATGKAYLAAAAAAQSA